MPLIIGQQTGLHETEETVLLLQKVLSLASKGLQQYGLMETGILFWTGNQTTLKSTPALR